MADDDVQLTDLEVIQRYSLAVRGASASRAELVAALQADLAWLQGGRRAPVKAAAPVKAPAPVKTPVKAPAPVKTPAKTAPGKAPVKAPAATRAPATKAPAKVAAGKRRA